MTPLTESVLSEMNKCKKSSQRSLFISYRDLRAPTSSPSTPQGRTLSLTTTIIVGHEHRWTSATYIRRTTTAIDSLSGTNGFRSFRLSPNQRPAHGTKSSIIQANGPLTSENVFDYFASSMFYDKQSNNQVLRMQTMHTGQPIANEAEELK